MGIFNRSKLNISKRKALPKARPHEMRPIRPLGRRALSPKARLAVGIASLLLGVSAMQANPHPSPTPNPVSQSSVERSRITAYTDQSVSGEGKGFRNFRFSQRITTNGPVIYAEQLTTNNQKPNNVKFGIAQKVVLPLETVAKLGLRTPELGAGRVDLKTTNVGLVLARKGISAEVHKLATSSATRYSFGSEVGKSKVNVDYMGPNYLSAEKSVRIGVDALEKTLKLDLGKLSTSMGLTFPEGRNPKVDVGLFYPTKFGGAGISASELPTGEKRVSAVLVINF